MKRIAAAALALALSATLVACDALTAPKPPDRPADITGAITTIEKSAAAGSLGGMLVEDPDGTDKAMVTVTSETRVFVRIAEGTAEAAFADLAAGDRVEVWFTGPVAESYPVQATAEAVLVSP